MKKKNCIACYLFVTIKFASVAPAQTTLGKFYSVNDNSIKLNNGTLSRTVYYDKSTHQFLSSDFSLDAGKENVIKSTSNEFYFELNGETFTGKNKWKFIQALPATDSNHGNGVEVMLRGDEPASMNLTLRITYLLYPAMPVIHKKIALENSGAEDIKIESLDVENFQLPFDITHTWVMKNYARQKHLGPYLGDWNDAAVVVHDVTGRRGILLGNEAPGVMKRTSVMLDGSTATIGLTHHNENFPFRKWLKRNESWESSWAFTILYQHTDDPSLVLNTSLNDFVRKYMGIRLASIPYKPTLVYNTWNPFQDHINEKIIDSLTDAAADCGIKEFVIDAGWFGKPEKNLSWTGILGDYDVDTKKFPHGLKPVFDKIRAKGMKPGLWMSLGSASKESNILSEHPEWFARTKDGRFANLHNAADTSMVTACLTTGWYNYIRDKILSYVKDYGLSYVKLDLSIVTGAYIYNNDFSGCYATNHQHRDREESYTMIYENALKLFDELHKAAPNLFIDCTFETAGKLQLIDYAIVKHAEGDWLLNFEDPQPFVSMRVRDLAWNRSPVMPATALVIGNMPLDDKRYDLLIPSLLGTLPIVLGDLTKIKRADRKIIRQWARWMDTMQQQYNYLMYRQDLQGFEEPSEESWDGFSRINTDAEKRGGIVAVFKQGSKENNRIVTISGLKAGKMYEVKKAPDGRLVFTKTGQQLMKNGFVVTITQSSGTAVFELSEKK